MGVFRLELEKVRQWVLGYPGAELLEKIWVDYHPGRPGDGRLAPEGVTEVSRREDILGNVTVVVRYEFAVWFVLPRGDDRDALDNAQWVLGFQEWVREQDLLGLAPRFGQEQVVRAQEGRLEKADVEGTAAYAVELSFEFKKGYEVS